MIRNIALCFQQKEDDTSLFDTRFTDQPPVDSPVDSKISASANQNFSGFTYVAPSVLEEIHRLNYQRMGEEAKMRGPRYVWTRDQGKEQLSYRDPAFCPL